MQITDLESKLDRSRRSPQLPPVVLWTGDDQVTQMHLSIERLAAKIRVGLSTGTALLAAVFVITLSRCAA